MTERCVVNTEPVLQLDGETLRLARQLAHGNVWFCRQKHCDAVALLYQECRRLAPLEQQVRQLKKDLEGVQILNEEVCASHLRKHHRMGRMGNAIQDAFAAAAKAKESLKKAAAAFREFNQTQLGAGPLSASEPNDGVA